MRLALYHLIQALVVLISEFVYYACVSCNWYIFIICPQGSSRHAQHNTLGFPFTLPLVFLHHEQIFRLLPKISVEENNWMSLWTNFSSPCLKAGLTKQILMQTNVACAHLTFLCSSLLPKRSAFKVTRPSFFWRGGTIILWSSLVSPPLLLS